LAAARSLWLAGAFRKRPGIRIFETSAKTGAGLQEWLAYLEDEWERKGS
jgi:Ni2+-binding GTPase involved in maturation of urease and hydrogenase